MSLKSGVVVMLLNSLLSAAQVPPRATADQAGLIASAREMALAAVTFHEGDLAGFTSAQSSFTSDGWNAFVKSMEGLIDRRGAPTFTSSFVPLPDVVFLGEKDGVVIFRIPGTLTHTSRLGRTSYRAALEVHAIRYGKSSARPARIQSLEQIACVGQSLACQ